MEPVPIGRREWFRFTTRFLLAVFAVAAFPLWWFRQRLVAANKQAEAVRKLEALGVYIGYRHEWDYENDRFSGAPTPGPFLLRAIFGDHLFLIPDSIIVTGHTPSGTDMSANYRQAISDERLKAVTDYVHAWLFNYG